MKTERPAPIATYRLQFQRDQGFAVATELVPYLGRLGVSHLYSSPILRARKGSTHGYDVIDPLLINPELGDEAEFRQLIHVLQNYGMGFLLDIVPNHMAASMENPYWQSVLTYGPSSPYAGWFDIDWRLPDPEMWGRVLAPVLGAPLKKMIFQNQIRIDWQQGRFVLNIEEQIFPLDPASIPRILYFGLIEVSASLSPLPQESERLFEIAKQLRALPSVIKRVHSAMNIDVESAEQVLGDLAQTIDRSPGVQEWAKQTAREFSQGDAGQKRLQKLIAAQSYRLVFWRRAARFMNYRRFFAINELVSVRQEDPRVFDATHETILRWVKEGFLDGLRIDHIDGLRDPLGYLDRLKEHLEVYRPAKLWVEKILGSDERLPAEWPVEGTTGYEFLNEVEHVFVSPAGFARIEQWYQQLQRRPRSFRQAVLAGKRRILKDDLSPHLGRLADMLLRMARHFHIAPAEPELLETAKQAELVPIPAGLAAEPLSTLPPKVNRRELSKETLTTALAEVIVALPVYRSYVQYGALELSERDRNYLAAALEGARREQVADPEALDLLQQIFLFKQQDDIPDDATKARWNFLEKFQQYTGPAAAKGIEDTALYSYCPLGSLNEVGGQPDIRLEESVQNLHQGNAYRALKLPHSMLGVTTHDTKRTADVRARLDVLTEIPELWKDRVEGWLRSHRPYRVKLGTMLAPDFSAEYLFYQTAVGIWPHASRMDGRDSAPSLEERIALRERLEQYMLKAIREAKRHTNWANPNQKYENSVLNFIRKLMPLDSSELSPFEQQLQALVERIAYAGYWNSLARTLIQFTAPGFPDIYQGDEVWNFALVDPDNRRPVDFSSRQAQLQDLLREMESGSNARQHSLQQLMESPETGLIKLFVIQASLQARRTYPELFSGGNYVPLDARGKAAKHVFAFLRKHEETEIIVVAPRLSLSLVQQASQPPVGNAVWQDTKLILEDKSTSRSWSSCLQGGQVAVTDAGTLSVGELLEGFPVGLFINRPLGN